MKGNLGKAILQTSAQFTEPTSAIWEYVINAIEYREKPDGLRVSITMNKNEVVISDNSNGMDHEILKNFFTFSGENLARKNKQASWLKRGINGSGKIAAFGFADELEVDTVKNYRRNAYKLTRKYIENNPQDSQEIPLKNLKLDEKVDEPNGTTIKISNLNSKPDQNKLIRKIEREISHWKSYDIKITVNSVVCEPKQLDIEKTYTFQSEGDIKDRYGDFKLNIHVSKYPLEGFDIGVKVLCNNNIVGIEDCGLGSSPYGNYLTGDVEIPELEKPIDNIFPFDQTRKQILNRTHKGVKELIFFMGPKLESVKKELVDKKNEERNSAKSKKLEKICDGLSNSLNDHWNDIKRKIDVIRGASNAKSALSEIFQPGSDEDIEAFIDGDGVSVSSEEEFRLGENVKNISPLNDPQNLVVENENSDNQAQKSSGKKLTRRKSGFIVVNENLGESEQRTLYKKDELKIIINLDHPSTVTCLKSCDDDVENISFKRFIFEAVCREFEHAIAQEFIDDSQGSYPPEDLLTEMRFHYDNILRSISSEFY